MRPNPHNPLYHIGIAQMTVDNADPLKDIGVYECIATSSRTTSSTARLRVYQIIGNFSLQ